MNTAKDFKGSSKLLKGCSATYEQNIYNKDDKELNIAHDDFNATIAYNGEKFILSYDDGMSIDAVAVLDFREAMKILRELIK